MSKNWLHRIKLFPQGLLLFELVSLWESQFSPKRELFRQFPQKGFKTSKNLILAVYGSFRGGKLFLLIFVPFYWFDQNKLFPSGLNFSLGLPFFKHVEKEQTLWVIFNSFWSSQFLTQREVSVNIRGNASNHLKSLVQLYIPHLEEEKYFC